MDVKIDRRAGGEDGDGERRPVDDRGGVEIALFGDVDDDHEVGSRAEMQRLREIIHGEDVASFQKAIDQQRIW